MIVIQNMDVVVHILIGDGMLVGVALQMIMIIIVVWIHVHFFVLPMEADTSKDIQVKGDLE